MCVCVCAFDWHTHARLDHVSLQGPRSGPSSRAAWVRAGNSLFFNSMSPSNGPFNGSQENEGAKVEREARNSLQLKLIRLFSV